MEWGGAMRFFVLLTILSRTSSETIAAAARGREGRMTYAQEIPPPFERALYRPLVHVVEGLTHRVRIIQSGNVNQYVAYIFIIVLIVLILRAI